MKKEYYLNSKQLNLLENCVVNWESVYDLAKRMEAGEYYPPVNIFYSEYRQRWEYNDGRHRVMAAKLIGGPLLVKSTKELGTRECSHCKNCDIGCFTTLFEVQYGGCQKCGELTAIRTKPLDLLCSDCANKEGKV